MYKTERMILGENLHLQYLHNNNNNNLHMLQKVIPNKKLRQCCPAQQFASFRKEVIFQKTHPQQKIQIVQNRT